VFTQAYPDSKRERRHLPVDVVMLATERQARLLCDAINSSKAQQDQAERQAREQHAARLDKLIAAAKAEPSA
jgi:hypothetical protein